MTFLHIGASCVSENATTKNIFQELDIVNI